MNKKETTNMKTSSLIIVQYTIQAIRASILASLNQERIDEAKDMHSLFENIALKYITTDYKLKYEYSIKGVKGKGGRDLKYDFAIIKPNNEKVLYELKLSDQEPPNSLEKAIIKKIAPDIRKFMNPLLKENERFILFGVRWDISKDPYKKYRDKFLISCSEYKNKGLIFKTNLDKLKKKDYKERIFIFGDDFCYDFSLDWAARSMLSIK
jgi:hypothetical protein